MDQDRKTDEKYQEKLRQATEKTRHSLAGFFITQHRFTYLVLLILILSGLYSMLVMPREAEPEIKVPYAVVTTVYPGANPSDIEELITDKIEKEVGKLKDVKLYSSQSGQGFSSVFVEFEAEADLIESLRKLQEATDNAETELPDDAESPVVTEINFNDIPIVTYSLVGGEYDEVALYNYADEIRNALEDVKDVSEVKMSGGLIREFQVIADPTKLAAYNISLSQISGALSRANFSLPAGSITIDNYEYGVRVKGRFEDISELGDIIIATYDNSPVYLRDLATIKDGFKDKDSASVIGFRNKASSPTISLQVFKRTGGNILNIVENSQKKINELYERGIIPENLSLEKTNDNSVFIKEDLRTLGQNGLQAIILITLMLMLAQSLRGALIAALSVPMAFVMAFLFLNLEGLTLNSMVLFSLVLSLGLMVDNSIVIIEGINEYVSRHKKSVLEAALLSVWNYKWAITSGTMTTVAAFLPMLLVSGIMGEYISVLPKTLTVTLVSSLFVALVVIPTFAVRFIKDRPAGQTPADDEKRLAWLEKRLKNVRIYYLKFMNRALLSKTWRRLSLAIAAFLFLTAVAIPALGFMKIEMFPKIDLDYFVINIKLPVGSTLDLTETVARAVEKKILAVPEMKNYVINLGNAQVLGPGSGGGSGEHLANFTVNLLDKDERKRTSYEIADAVRQELLSVQGGEITTEELSAGPPTGAPIEIRIFGDDLAGIARVASDIKNILRSFPGVINVKDNLEDAAGEFTFTVNKQKADYYGLDTLSIASALRNALYGARATELNIDGDDVDITVKYDKNAFASADDLDNIILNSPTAQNIPLKEVAKAEFNSALLSISHRDGEKYAAVSADLEKGTDLKVILENFEAAKAQIILPDNFIIKMGGEMEDIEKSFKETFLSLGLAIILIAVILVLQFNSFKQPFIILLSLPLAIIGVIYGLLILGEPFSFLAFIGIVSLAGIVVNDAIVLIDQINKNIENGDEVTAAIVNAGAARMQPIILTTATTIAGVFTLIYSGELWRGFSYTLIFGLLTSTILTLYIIPILYFILCRKECWERSGQEPQKFMDT